MKIVRFFIGSGLLLLTLTTIVQAETSFGVANHYPIKDTTVKDGDIISYSPSGYLLSRVEQDPFMIGVVTDTPAISIDMKSSSKTYPVVATGTVYVNVSTINGPIKKGESITSSAKPGVGEKNTKDGYILGFALQDFNADSQDEIGQIAASINIRYYSVSTSSSGSLSDIASLTKLSFYQEPIKVLRLVIAGIILISSFVIGFISFGRIANTGVESIGRNPLAGKMIEFGVLINVLITVAIVGSGFGLAYLVLRL